MVMIKIQAVNDCLVYRKYRFCGALQQTMYVQKMGTWSRWEHYDDMSKDVPLSNRFWVPDLQLFDTKETNHGSNKLWEMWYTQRISAKWKRCRFNKCLAPKLYNRNLKKSCEKDFLNLQKTWLMTDASDNLTDNLQYQILILKQCCEVKKLIRTLTFPVSNSWL